jgi:hypothetical protein
LVLTVSRLALPAGLAITTAIHTSFAERSDITYPEVPYTNVFYTTLSLSVLALTLVPFLNLDKPASRPRTRNPVSLLVNVDTSQDLAYKGFVDTPSFSIQPRKSSLYANQTKTAVEREQSITHTEAGPSTTHHVGSQRSSATGDRVIWLVCEDCGASKRMVEQVGDPLRYFYDGGGNGTAEQTAGSATTSTGSATSTVRRFPLCKDLNSLRG